MILKSLSKAFEKRKTVSTLTIGVGVTSCKRCSKLNKGVEIYEAFDWGSDSLDRIIGFDRTTREITVNADRLMRIIQLVNPVQKERPLKLVSEDEFFGSQQASN